MATIGGIPCFQTYPYYHAGIYNIGMPNSSPDLFQRDKGKREKSQVYKGGKTCRNTKHTCYFQNDVHNVGPPSYKLVYKPH